MMHDQDSQTHDWERLASETNWSKLSSGESLQLYVIAIMTAYSTSNVLSNITNIPRREVYEVMLTATVTRLARDVDDEKIKDILHDWLTEPVVHYDKCVELLDELTLRLLIPETDNSGHP